MTIIFDNDLCDYSSKIRLVTNIKSILFSFYKGKSLFKMKNHSRVSYHHLLFFFLVDDIKDVKTEYKNQKIILKWSISQPLVSIDELETYLEFLNYISATKFSKKNNSMLPLITRLGYKRLFFIAIRQKCCLSPLVCDSHFLST